MNFQSVMFKAPKARKSQRWVVYPHSANDESWQIQSDTRIAQVGKTSGRMLMSSARANGSYNIDLMEIRGAVWIDSPDQLIKDLNALPATGKIIKLTG